VSDTLYIYRCPDCFKITEGWKQGPRYCAGNQWSIERPLEPHKGDHPSIEMERLLVRIVAP
jgi:hypothetical protein